MPKDPSKVVEKFARNFAASQTDYEEGVRNPAKSWQENMVSSEGRMVRGFQEAASSGRIRQGVQNKGDEGWKRDTLEKASRFGASAERAKTNFAAKVQDVINAGEAGRAAANRIPNDTMDQRLQRMVANAKAIHEYHQARR